MPEIQSGWKVVSDGICPIGDGLWGREPASSKGQFWVQCGLLKGVPKDWFATELHQSVLQDQIVLLKEEEEYRCLAGPYGRYSIALKVRNAMREQPALKMAFIRELETPFSLASIVPIVTEPMMAVKAEKEIVAEVVETVAHVSIPVIKTAPEPVVLIKEPEPVNTVKKVPRAKRSRTYFEVAGLQSPKPRYQDQRYTDGGKSWWRATYEEASVACENDGMSLVSMETLRSLARDTETRRDFPKRLPYWVKEQKAYDIVMMVPMPLRESSLIHVLCEE
nr:SPOR domain-containing protein [Enterovibrio nigricans]